MARITGSWLSGPNAADSGDPLPDEYPGKLLGLPKSGVGSLAPMSRRIVAMFVDWIIATGIAALIVRPDPARIIARTHVAAGQQPPTNFEAVTSALSTPTFLVWFVLGVATVTLFGFTPGQYFLRMRVVRVDVIEAMAEGRSGSAAGQAKPPGFDAAVGFVRALVRQVLLIFVVPALFADSDGRGMHDRATGTGLARTR
ncbi:RDD family protein [Nocardia sp. CA2R105]|uniref:RDD family protein n=1 Tax=Nocardia coffeae TaxID=2873381 RepID=UPI001CA62169|nr:RDD family protein [Nocardia coffeae]MBY8863120.1 RDD family protein [Nocardia coffeae]